MKVPAESIAKILEMSRSGNSATSVAKELGLASSTVRGILKRNTTAAIPQEQSVDVSIEDTQMPSLALIGQTDADQFLNSINAVAPAVPDAPVSDAMETKSLSQRINLAESFLTSDAMRPASSKGGLFKSRALRMPKVLEDVAEDTIPAQPGPLSPVVAPRSVAAVPSDASSKADLIAKITMNVEAFEPLLGSVVQPNRQSFVSSLYGKNERDLHVLLAVINKTRTLANVTNQLKGTLYMAAQGMEAITTKFIKMKTEGFAQAIMSQDEEIKMILKEMVMEQMESFDKYQRPELRLALLFSTTLLMTDSANRMKEASKQRVEAKVASATIQKHSDL